MELMEVYHEALATRIIARVTNGKCEGAEFVFGLIESAIRKEATEIVLIPVQELDMVRMIESELFFLQSVAQLDLNPSSARHKLRGTHISK